MTNDRSLDLAACLREAPALSGSRREELARLLPHVSAAFFEEGKDIASAGQEADHLYLLVRGKVALTSPQGRTVLSDGDCFGIEAATDRSTYALCARALGPVTAVRVPRKSLAKFLATHPALRSHLHLGLLSQLCGEAAQPRPAALPVRKAEDGSWFQIAGWALTLVVPGALLFAGSHWGLAQNATLFLAIFAATVVMWVFALVDEYIPALFAVLSTLMMELVPAPMILSGFVSDGFFEAMSILGLGVVIVTSGLSFRMLLGLLRWLPNRPFWQGMGLLVLGFLVTPVVPSNNARVVLVKPILTEMTELLGLKPRGKAATGLAIAAFTGVNLLTSVFLSAKSANFVIQGLLSAQGRLQFQWLSWLAAASVTGALMLAFHLAGAALLFRSGERPRLSREQVAAQLGLLGPLKPSEWAAIAGSGVFAAGVITASLSKLHPPWLALTILYGLLLLRFLDKAQFRERIDWPFLIYLGGMVGIVKAFNVLGFGALISHHLSWLGESMRTGLPGFILLLCGLLFVLRLAMPTSATAAIAATVFMPLAEVNGINPWVIGFIILVVSEMWVLPYQCSYYSQFREATEGGPAYSERWFLGYNLLMNVAKLAAIYASLPYWKGLGFL